MRLVLRILGADLIELATGRDAQPASDDTIQAVAGSVAADLQPAPQRLGFHQADDEPLTFPDDRT